MTVSEAFEMFKSELELPDRKQKEAAEAQQAIREAIKNHLYVSNSFLTGSYARYTKIDPLNDIDVFLVRTDSRTGLRTDGGGVKPDEAISQVADAVRKAIPRATIQLQSRSVNVGIPGLAFGFDLVPAWLRSPDGYWIPDRDAGTWLPTDPVVHGDLLTAANTRLDKKLKPVIKMVKHWSRKNLDLLRSFHLELICMDVFAQKSITNFQIGVATVLVNLVNYIGREMKDPVYGVSRVDRPLSGDELQNLKTRVGYDANNVVAALELESSGQHQAAIEKWKHVFVGGFPR